MGGLRPLAERQERGRKRTFPCDACRPAVRAVETSDAELDCGEGDERRQGARQTTNLRPSLFSLRPTEQRLQIPVLRLVSSASRQKNERKAKSYEQTALLRNQNGPPLQISHSACGRGVVARSDNLGSCRRRREWAKWQRRRRSDHRQSIASPRRRTAATAPTAAVAAAAALALWSPAEAKARMSVRSRAEVAAPVGTAQRLLLLRGSGRRRRRRRGGSLSPASGATFTNSGAVTGGSGGGGRGSQYINFFGGAARAAQAARGCHSRRPARRS